MNLGGAVRLNRTGFLILLVIALYLVYAYSFKAKETEDKVIDLRQLLTVSIKAAQNGGNEVVSTKDNLKIESKGKTKEGVNDSVTTADFRSHCAMLATLKRSFPDVLIVSEEAKTKCDSNLDVDYNENPVDEVLKGTPVDFVNENDVTVWIDPLDATKEYTEKLYQYVTTMVCVAVKGKPMIGVIYKPFSKEVSWAWVGKSHSIVVPNEQENTINNQLKILISRSHTGNKLEGDLKSAFPDSQITLAAGAGYKALEVAAGHANAYVHATSIKKWDICAGNAILNALGGKMTTKDNQLIDYGDTYNVVNNEGLVATLKDHELFLTKF